MDRLADRHGYHRAAGRAPPGRLGQNVHGVKGFDGAAARKFHELLFLFQVVFVPQDAELHNPASAENPPPLSFRLPGASHKVVETAGA
jgi:hypothetical protein